MTADSRPPTAVVQHQAEVEAYLNQRRQTAAEVRQRNEARFDPAGIRDRLLARRANKEA